MLGFVQKHIAKNVMVMVCQVVKFSNNPSPGHKTGAGQILGGSKTRKNATHTHTLFKVKSMFIISYKVAIIPIKMWTNGYKIPNKML